LQCDFQRHQRIPVECHAIPTQMVLGLLRFRQRSEIASDRVRGKVAQAGVASTRESIRRQRSRGIPELVARGRLHLNRCPPVGVDCAVLCGVGNAPTL
jgi:hypothetical protein